MGGNHFNYAHFHHLSTEFFTLCRTVMTLIMIQILDSVTLCHTNPHFSALFSITDHRLRPLYAAVDDLDHTIIHYRAL
jgi:hypothetical protein